MRMRLSTWRKRRPKGQKVTGMAVEAETLCQGPDCPDSLVLKVPITFTHVLYDRGDMLGMLLAWFSLSPIFILVGFITLIMFHRDLHTILYFAGVVFNEGINFGLKHTIKEPRPTSGLAEQTLFVEYGMPSSHAQFMAFFASYFTLFVFVRAVLSTGKCDYVWKALSAAAAIGAAFTSCASRVYLGYHSIAQVMCGVGLGCVLGVAWFFTVHQFLSPYFPQIYSWKISELFLLMDVSHIPNYLWFKYTSARGETRRRTRFKSM